MHLSRNRFFHLFIVLFAPLLSVVDVYIVNMALPEIKAQYHTTHGMTELVINSYLVGYCVFLITGGRAGDFFGRKKTYVTGMFAFTLFSALCGWAQTIDQLLFYRFFQGVSAAIMIPQTLAIIQIEFRSAKDRVKAFGSFGITLGIASILGQFLGGYFISTTWMEESWRLIFLINLPFGILNILLASCFLKETRHNEKGRFDWSGVILLTFSLSFLVYALTMIPEEGLTSFIMTLLALSAIGFYFFWRNQKRKTNNEANPLMNTTLFNIKSFNFVLLIVLFFFGAHNSYLLMCAIQFKNTLHISSLAAAQYFTFNGIGFLFSSIIAFKYLNKYGISLLIGGCMLMLTSVVCQIFSLVNPENAGYIPLFMFIYGLGQGTLLPSILNYALRKIPYEFSALAGGVYSTVQQFSSALGMCIIGSLFFFSLNNGFNAYQIGMGMVAAYLAVVGILLYRLSKFKTVSGTAKTINE
ncbi:MFS transporter [Chryseobacterium sp. JM1]|uniref:MFS transporter n=1 Tax=Chryseobacterium sp. JM1 TaxID=1233950 RepID=UPI0004E74073|nr:MFS transporter [Chryseobacterium sp. JM1]KFF21352.1 hypothetical protein IW22_10205 [Chryseobacterium sp. JM1]